MSYINNSQQLLELTQQPIMQLIAAYSTHVPNNTQLASPDVFVLSLFLFSSLICILIIAIVIVISNDS